MTSKAKEFRNISDLKLWKDNPRAIDEVDFQRLKTQIKRLGQYKPLVITADGEVIGGNMRLRAYQELGVKDAWVSIVKPKSDAEKLEYALSDNDRAGYYQEDSLAELLSHHPEVDMASYKLDLGKLTSVEDLLKQYGIGEYGEDFDLEDGQDPGFQQMTFILASEQVELIKDCMKEEIQPEEDFGNKNSHGNALYSICKQWHQQKKSNSK